LSFFTECLQDSLRNKCYYGSGQAVPALDSEDNKLKESVAMCDMKDIETTEELQVLFTDDIDLLEDRLSDIIIAMGLPEEQTNAILRLINDALEDHHLNILDSFEETLGDKDDEEIE
jgi:hypothetical protein